MILTQCDTMSRISICGNNEIPGWCLRWECPALTGAPDIRRWSLLTPHSGPGGARHFTVTGHSTYGERCPAPDTGQAAAGENIQTRFCPAMMMRWWYDPHNVSSGYMTCHDTRCIAGHHTANLVALNTLHHPQHSTPISAFLAANKTDIFFIFFGCVKRQKTFRINHVSLYTEHVYACTSFINSNCLSFFLV